MLLRNYTFWLKTFVVVSILTGLVHSISLFIKPEAANETEEQLIQSMEIYKMNAGAGFDPSMRELFTALSSCFTLVYLLGAFITWYLIKKKVNAEILKGITVIQLIIFGVSFIIMLVFTFLPPIVLTGLTFFILALGYVTNKSTA